MGYHFIADEMNDLDKGAGFEIKSIENPKRHYWLEQPEIPAVICEVGESDRIIKINETNGISIYRHQRYGIWPFQEDEDKASWLPCGDEYWFRPEDAVNAVKNKIGKECGNISIKTIIPRG